MPYLLDTNIISEVMKPAPNTSVLHWIEQHRDGLMLSAITVEELRFGQLMMDSGKKQTALQGFIDRLIVDFDGAILPFDTAAAEICAVYHEQAIGCGRTPTIEDLIIASIAVINGCTLATRNLRDFEYLGIEVTNPFDCL